MDNEAISRVVKISSGIPGTISVFGQLYGGRYAEATPILDFCEKHGLTGSAIWVWYKRECEENLENLVKSSV